MRWGLSDVFYKFNRKWVKGNRPNFPVLSIFQTTQLQTFLHPLASDILVTFARKQTSLKILWNCANAKIFFTSTVWPISSTNGCKLSRMRKRKAQKLAKSLTFADNVTQKYFTSLQTNWYAKVVQKFANQWQKVRSSHLCKFSFLLEEFLVLCLELW